MTHTQKFCTVCGIMISPGAKPNKEYVMLGYSYYCRACYLKEIGVTKEA
jgi:hypothetical protein